MPATPIVTMEAATRLLEALEAFLDESEASFSLVIDRGGAVLCQAGRVPDNIDPADRNSKRMTSAGGTRRRSRKGASSRGLARNRRCRRPPPGIGP